MNEKVPAEFKAPQSRRSREQIGLLHKKYAKLKTNVDELEDFLYGNGHGIKTRLALIEEKVDVLIHWMDIQKSEFTVKEFHDMSSRLKRVEEKISNIGGAWTVVSLLIQAGGFAVIIGLLKHYLEGPK